MKNRVTLFGMVAFFAAGVFVLTPRAMARVLPLEDTLQPVQTVTLDDEKSDTKKETKEEKKKRKAEERARKKEEREAKREAKRKAKDEKEEKEHAEA